MIALDINPLQIAQPMLSHSEKVVRARKTGLTFHHHAWELCHAR